MACTNLFKNSGVPQKNIIMVDRTGVIYRGRDGLNQWKSSHAVDTKLRTLDEAIDGADVFLASAELSAIASVIGRLPTVEEYHKYMDDINPLSDEIYRYLNFNEIETYVESANSANIPAVNIVNPS